jgi:hypothetical protein
MQVAVQVDNGFLSPDFYFEMIVTLESPDLTGFVKDEGVDYTKCFDDRGTPSIDTGTRVCTGQLQNQLVEECVLYGGIALWTLYKYIHTCSLSRRNNNNTDRECSGLCDPELGGALRADCVEAGNIYVYGGNGVYGGTGEEIVRFSLLLLLLYCIVFLFNVLKIYTINCC